jgi:hypothetical protein
MMPCHMMPCHHAVSAQVMRSLHSQLHLPAYGLGSIWLRQHIRPRAACLHACAQAVQGGQQGKEGGMHQAPTADKHRPLDG